MDEVDEHDVPRTPQVSILLRGAKTTHVLGQDMAAKLLENHFNNSWKAVFKECLCHLKIPYTSVPTT